MTDAPKLTARQQQVYDALTNDWACSYDVAKRAGIRTQSPTETAARHCIALVKMGLVERGTARWFANWRKKQ